MQMLRKPLHCRKTAIAFWTESQRAGPVAQHTIYKPGWVKNRFSAIDLILDRMIEELWRHRCESSSLTPLANLTLEKNRIQVNLWMKRRIPASWMVIPITTLSRSSVSVNYQFCHLRFHFINLVYSWADLAGAHGLFKSCVFLMLDMSYLI